METTKRAAKNVLGTALRGCCDDPVTGFYRNGRCDTGPGDGGVHVVCAVLTRGFLRFTKERGNDLSTPREEYRFPGLTAGDRWCLCVTRWREALEAYRAGEIDEGAVPRVVLEATHVAALEWVSREELEGFAVSNDD